MNSEMYHLGSGQQPDDNDIDWTLQEYDVTCQNELGNLLVLPDPSYTQYQNFSEHPFGYNAAPQPQLHLSVEQEMPLLPSHPVLDASVSAFDPQAVGTNDYYQSPVPTSDIPTQLPYTTPNNLDDAIWMEQHRTWSETSWLPSYNLEPPWPEFNSQRITSNLLGVPPDPGNHRQSIIQHVFGASFLPSDYLDPSVVPCPLDHTGNTSVHPTALAPPQDTFQCGNGTSYSQWPPAVPFRNEHIALERGQPEATRFQVSPQIQARPTTMGRKRPRNLGEAGEPPSSASQEFYGPGFQAGSSLEIIPYRLPGSQGEICTVHKKTRRVDEKIDKACFLCRLKKRKCKPSGAGPCATCQTWLQRLAQLIPVPRFTCDLQTTFAEIDLFSTQRVGAAAENFQGLENSVISSPEGSDTIRHLLKPYVTILDILEPFKLRTLLWENESSACYPGYIGTLLKWKVALLYIAPALKYLNGALERIHMKLWRELFAILDRPNLYNDKDTLLLLYFMCEEEFRIWRHLDMVDQRAADHVESCFENRRAILGSMIQEELDSIAKGSQKRTTKKEKPTDLRFAVAELLKCRDPQPRRKHVWLHIQPKEQCQCLPCPMIDSGQQESRQIGGRPRCFCSWILNWLPKAYLQCFGYDAESFVQKLHDPGHIFHDLVSIVAPVHDSMSELSRSSYTTVTGLQSRLADSVLHVSMKHLSKNASSKAAPPWVTYCQTFDYIAEYNEVLLMLLSTSIWLSSDLVLLVCKANPSWPSFMAVASWICGEGFRKLKALDATLSSCMDEIMSRRTSRLKRNDFCKPTPTQTK